MLDIQLKFIQNWYRPLCFFFFAFLFFFIHLFIIIFVVGHFFPLTHTLNVDERARMHTILFLFFPHRLRFSIWSIRNSIIVCSFSLFGHCSTKHKFVSVYDDLLVSQANRTRFDASKNTIQFFFVFSFSRSSFICRLHSRASCIFIKLRSISVGNKMSECAFISLRWQFPELDCARLTAINGQNATDNERANEC